MTEPVKHEKASPSAIYGIMLLVFLLAPDFFVGLPDLVAVISVAAAAAGTALLFMNAPLPVGLLTTALCFVRGWYQTSSPLYALGFVVHLPFALALVLTLRGKLSRGASITLFASLTSLAALITMGIQVYAIAGELTVEAIMSVFSPFMNTLSEFLSESFTVTIAGKELSYFNNTTVDAMLRLFLGIFPGLLTLLLLLLGYLASFFYRILLGILFLRPSARVRWKLTPSPITAVYFILVLLLSLFLPDSGVPWLAATNLTLFLIPTFLVAGLGGSFALQTVNGLPHPKLLRPTLILLSLFSGLLTCMALLIAFGLFDTIKASLPKRKTSD